MIEELVEYLGGAPCIALVGSGPSAECGLPTWRKLAEEILDRITALTLSDEETRPIEEAHAHADYPLMFERVARAKRLGESFLYDTCRELLKTPDKRGKAYNALVRLPFLAYFTTNFDDLLSKHLELANVAPIPLKNTSADLAKADLDALQGHVIKLHGDF
ncbi:MAG: SIR2 family protein, partial [Terriglobia bacterium]